MNFSVLHEKDLSHLYHKGDFGLPYRVYKRGPKNMKHFPSKKEKTSDGTWRDWDNNNVAIGIRGVTVEDPTAVATQQKVWLHWCGIDIDWPNKPEFKKPEELYNAVSRYMYGDASIRASKSGNGLHLFFLLDKPYEFFGTEAAAAAAHRFIMPIVERLNKVGVETCMRGLPNLWVWGGKQYWRYQSSRYHSLPAEAISQSRKSSLTRNAAAPSEGFAGSIVTALLAAGIELPTNHVQINVGAVKRALKDLLPFETVSKCRIENEGESNGFISFDDYHISLFSSPDNVGGIGSGWLFKIPRED